MAEQGRRRPAAGLLVNERPRRLPAGAVGTTISVYANEHAAQRRGAPAMTRSHWFRRHRSRGLLAEAIALAGMLGAAHGAEAGVKAEAVGDDVWFVQGQAAMGASANRNFISNAGFVVTGEGVVVVDALGSPALAQDLIAEIARITPQPIRYVVVTHYHADHIYGLQAFQAAGAKIIAHPAAREYLNADTAQRRLEASRQELAPWIDERTRLVTPDQWLDGERLSLRLGGVDVHIHHLGPAHTPEDLVVHVPQRGVLFAGDLVFRGRVPFVGQADSRHWIAALSRLIGFAPQVLLPGHGPLSRTALDDLTLTRDYLAHLRQSMGQAARNLEPFDEAYAKADWSRFQSLPLFGVVNRMNAYNTYLLMEQEK
jgi:glyoxylase-like metal-dependent hydrolase (beta-lactamase superfamily II)